MILKNKWLSQPIRQKGLSQVLRYKYRICPQNRQLCGEALSNQVVSPRKPGYGGYPVKKIKILRTETTCAPFESLYWCGRGEWSNLKKNIFQDK